MLLFALIFDMANFRDHNLFIDHKCGYCSLLPNLFSGFGWNPGNKLLKWFGETLRDRTGNADITFREVSNLFISVSSGRVLSNECLERIVTACWSSGG